MAYRFVQVPVAVLNDERLQAIDVHAYGVMLDASRDGLATISEERLGKRLRKSEDTARRSIRRLVAAAWVEVVDNGNGFCREYKLVTPSNDATGLEATPLATMQGVTPSNGAAQPLAMVRRTPSNAATQPIRTPRIIPRAKPERSANAALRSSLRAVLVAELERCPRNGKTAEAEADRLINWFPGLERFLLGHLRYALAEQVEDPIEYASRQTQRGEPPKTFAGGTPPDAI